MSHQIVPVNFPGISIPAAVLGASWLARYMDFSPAWNAILTAGAAYLGYQQLENGLGNRQVERQTGLELPLVTHLEERVIAEQNQRIRAAFREILKNRTPMEERIRITLFLNRASVAMKEEWLKGDAAARKKLVASMEIPITEYLAFLQRMREGIERANPV